MMIKDNIVFGKDGVFMEEIIEVVKVVNVYIFIF